MASCLYECLCEAELEKYYPHFVALGFQRIDELAKVSMKDYAKLGVHNMKDRKRLFQLIRIIKVLQAEDEAAGKKWQRFQTGALHPRPQVTRCGPRRQLHFDSLSEDRDGGKDPALSSCSASKDKDDLASVLSHNSELKGSIKTSLNAAERWAEQKLCVPAVGSSNDIAPLLGDIETPIVQRVPHTSGYNYGVPHSSIRANSCEKETPWTETDKIRVCVRKRPLGLKEERRGEVNIITVEDKETLLLHEKKEAVDLTQYILQHVFYFDEVFGESCSNQDVYMKTAYPLIQHIFNGGNATCFAYGQTGAGKTYTMIGTQQNPGLYALAAQDIFRHLETSQARKDLHVCISFYEIYCGQLYDLLNGRKRLFAREDSKHIVQIVGLREVQVKTVSLLLEVILKGGKERSTGATGVNSDSSRSHAIIQLQIKDAANRASGRISFIDLAGSERAADAKDADRQTKMEGAEINQSLLALKECIRALDQEHAHTPFRQSKLTQVLKDSFIGNSKTCMIANVSPSHVATEHTLNTLRYADRVKELKKGIKCCTPVANRRPSPGGASPKRVQSSPYVQPGEKSSPKKVKLGSQHLQTPLASRTKGPHLLFHPLCPPYASTPRGQAYKGPVDVPWFGRTSPVKGIPRAGPLAKKGAEDPAVPSPQSHTGRSFGAQRERGQEDQPHGKCPKVQPVQKQLLSRGDLSLADPVRQSACPEGGGKACAEQRPAAWASAPQQQKDREHHLRLFHQQFQQPPILQQKLNYQPLERFLAQYKPQECRVKPEPPGQPPASPWSGDETMQLEDLEDSDFSEDSFSAGSSWKKPEAKAQTECGPRSFFLHQREGRTEAHKAQKGQDPFLNESELEEEGGVALLRPERPTSSGEGSDHRSGWSPEEASALDPFPETEMPEKPYCSHGDRASSQGHPKGTDLPRSGPDKHAALAPQNPPPLCPQGSFSCTDSSRTADAGRGAHLPVPGTGGEKGLLTGAGLGGVLDFSVDFASAASPLTGALLDSGTTAALRAMQGVMQKNPFGPQDPLDGGTREHHGEEASPALSLYEVGPWERGALHELCPQAKCQRLSERSSAPASKEVHGLLGGCSARETGAVGFISSRPACQGALLPSNPQGSERAPGPRCEGDAEATASQSRFEEFRLGGGEGPKPVAKLTGPGAVGKASGSRVFPGCDATNRETPGESSCSRLGTHLDRAHSGETLNLTFSGEDVGPLQSTLTQEMPTRAVVSKATNARSRPNTTDSCKSLPQHPAASGREFVLRIHQEQLDEMAALCLQEDDLICRMPGLDFEDFVIKLDEILLLKSKCIQRTRTQLKSFLAPSEATEAQ